MDKVRLLLADDHRIVREGLKMILESSSKYAVIEEANNGDELVAKAMSCKPDLIVSDLKMPGTSIIDSCRSMKEEMPELKVMILTAYDESEDVFRALDSQVDGYVMKDTVPEQILHTMDMVMMGYSCFHSKLQRRRKEETNVLLTEREQEIFELIVENLSNQEIAQRLFISEATVKTHVSSILRKTGQPNRSQAVLYGLKKGMVKVVR
ncbi:response regulator transcription factor [Brevibacillus ruminantium]|uniref:Response regulator transcription factor n=1 Tax=Brevibacillus ruminantium TaxID=2950604 RepID=A0ABY4WHJ5_9BACL|nr:response regulator transcription factor [Brevibacillus ruminantium]USG66286.1 response regulator transcription factor [Brevibacillus ruminantium]